MVNFHALSIKKRLTFRVCTIDKPTTMKKMAMFFLFMAQAAFAQKTDADVLRANASIDAGVVTKDMAALQKLYADDFVFTHGTGLVEGKASWLKNVQSPDVQFKQRKQDSTQVEMHNDVAIVIGRLDIVREQKHQTATYGIWYVRVFVWRAKRWQLISHRTTREWH
jgi:ketosteroid isomerase-like protein